MRASATFPGRRERGASEGVAEGAGGREDRGRLGGGENLIPPAEPHAKFERHGERLRRPAAGVLSRPFRRRFGDHRVDRADRPRALTAHHGGERQHVAVVKHVETIKPLVRPDLAIGGVGRDRLLVRPLRLGPAAAADVDVRGHVNQVWQARLEVAEPVGGGVRLLGARRCLERVDVEVERQRMARLLGDHRLEHLHDLLGARLGPAVARPKRPRAEVHQRFGVEPRSMRRRRRGIWLQTRAHRVGVRFVERTSIGGRRVGVSLGEGGDQRPFDGTGARGSLASHRQRRGPVAGVRLIDRRIVDVRAASVGDAPPSHRAARIERRGLPERADRLVVVERVEKLQALVEVTLGFGRGGRHRAAPRPEPVEQWLTSVWAARSRIAGVGFGSSAFPLALKPSGRAQEYQQEKSTHGDDSRGVGNSRPASRPIMFRRRKSDVQAF